MSGFRLRGAIAIVMAAWMVLAVSLAAAAPSRAPTTIPVGAEPFEVASGAGGLWVVTYDGQYQLRRFDSATGRQVGTPVPLGMPLGPWLFTSPQPFNSPLVPCCGVPFPLVVSAGSAWTVGEGAIVRVTPAGAENRVVRIPLSAPRDVTAGRGGIWALETQVPEGAVPGSIPGKRVVRIDPATNMVAPGQVFDFIPPGSQTRLVFQSGGPLQMAVGDPGVAWLTHASVRMTLVRFDPAAGRIPLPAASAPARLISRRSGVTWAVGSYSCTLTRLAPDGRRTAVRGSWRALVPNCSLRRIEADGHGRLWAVGGWLPAGQRGMVFRIGSNGRVLGRPIRVGRDPVAIAPVAGGAWVADATARTLVFVRSR